MDTRRFLLATLLSVAVLLLWQQLFPPPEPPPRPEPVAAPAEAEPPALAPPPSESAAPGPDEAEPEAAAAEPEPPAEPVAADSERQVTLESELFEAVFTNRGARLVALYLKRHSAASGDPVNLVREREGYLYPLTVTDRQGETGWLDDALFAVERGPGGGSVLFRYAGEEGTASKRFSLAGPGELRLEIELPGRTDWGLFLGPGIRNPTSDETDNRFLLRDVIYRQGDEIERIGSRKADEVTLVPAIGLRWIGIQDTYFLNAIMPREGVDQVLVRPLVQLPDGSFRPRAEGKPEKGEIAELALVVQPAAPRLVVDSYWGAKEYDRLAELGPEPGRSYGLERTVELGWFRFLSLPLLKGLQWIHDNLVANYGWAIVLLTIAIRILLFPLMHKSTVSMQKMQELNPKVQAIRQKYRSKLKDKQGRPNAEAQRKMHEEVMAVYKAEGVNPAGGCLPLLLQMPVLFAFYRLLSAAIELRHAPWLGWIDDLSAPDPYFVLPVVMGASQFLQQKLTPTAADPMQRRIFQLMPIFFTLLFLGFPSGLVLYWLTNNLLGIAQQAAYQRFRPTPAAATAGRPKKKPKPQGAKGR